MEIVINSDYGGFSLSPEATLAFYKAGCTELATPVKEYFGERFDSPETDIMGYKHAIIKWNEYKKSKKTDRAPIFLTILSDDGEFAISNRPNEKYRNDKRLVKIVKKMGKKANGGCASLKIVKIPNNVDWIIQEYDGAEWVAEKHRTWYAD